MSRGKRLSDATFIALFCVWVLTAVPGIVLALSSAWVLLDPSPEAHGGALATPVDANPARTLGLGLLLIAWPLPLYRKADAPVRVPGFGRG